VKHKQIVARMKDVHKDMERLAKRAEGSGLTVEDEVAWVQLRGEFDDLEEQRKRLEREADVTRVRELAGDPSNLVAGSDQGILERDPLRDSRDVERPRYANPWQGIPLDDARHTMSPHETRSRALSAIEKSSGSADVARQRAAEVIEEFDDPQATLARQALLTSDPNYVSGWSRLMVGDTLLTEEETRAVRRVRDLQRAMSLTDGAGGYLVPFQLDPSLIITGAGVQSDIRRIARKVVATGNEWHGVSAAQISASWDAEASEVSDDSPTLVQPSIPIHMMRLFVPFSIEVGMDAPNLTEELIRLFVDAQNNLEGATLATGTGSGQPTGIVTALTGTASVLSSAGTDVFALGDLYAAYNALAARYKDSSTWLANELIYTLTRQFGTADSHAFWTHLDGPTPAQLLGRPVAKSSSMDGTISAGADNHVLVLGAFDNFVLADRIGLTVEPIAHLFHTGANRPSGQRGLFGFARLGADSVNDGAFVQLNIT
jgi:HK97 family phage major capsid protein